MNRNPDVELVLHEWLADDGDIAPDRILEVVADRIARQPRRLASRLPWRPFMNSQLKLVVGVAAAVVVAFAAWQLLPSQPGSGGTPTSTPSPTATPNPTAQPSPTAIPPLPEGTLAAGTYRLLPLRSAPNLSVDVVVPAGWTGDLSGPRGPNGPAGIFLAFLVADGIFSEPCQWDIDGSGPGQPGDIEVGPGRVHRASLR